MGFMKPKAPAPTPVPTAEPAVAQAVVDQAEADKTLKKKQQLRAGKSTLTVGLKPDAGLNTGSTTTGSSSGLSVGGA